MESLSVLNTDWRIRGMCIVIVCLLLAVIDAAQAKGDTIVGAVRRGDVQAVRRYLNENPKYIRQRHGANRTLLTYAAFFKQPEVVRILVDSGADVNHEGFMRMTPLADGLASWGGRADDAVMFEIASILVRAGAAIDHRDGYGETPIFWAVTKQYVSVVRLLIAHGANVNAIDNTGGGAGDSVLLRAATLDNEEIVRMLLRAGASASVKNARGKTALDVAIKYGHDNVVSVLLQYSRHDGE